MHLHQDLPEIAEQALIEKNRVWFTYTNCGLKITTKKQNKKQTDRFERIWADVKLFTINEAIALKKTQLYIQSIKRSKKMTDV